MDFAQIPNDVLQPLFYAEVSSSKAAGGATSRPTLLMGQMLPSGTATANVPVRVASGAQGNSLFGFGSQLARICHAYFLNDPYAEVWAIPVVDAGTAVKASKKLTITGPATAAGVLNLYIAGQKLAISVASGDSADIIGGKIQTALGVDEAGAVTTKSTYPVTASNTTGEVTFTARNGGLVGNRIDLRVNYLGSAGGESYPAGVAITELASVTHVNLASGETNPTLTTAIANMGDTRYSYVVHPWTDATSLDAFQKEFADAPTGRWGPIRRTYGHVFTADDDTYTSLSTTGLATAMNNDPHCSSFVFEASPTPCYEVAAAFGGRAAQSLRVDPARPLNTLELFGVLAPAAADQFSWSEREVLLGLGMTTPMISSDGTCRIQRAITNRTKNAYGAADSAYRDITTPATLDYLLTEMESMVTTRYGRHKLVSDGTQVAPGAAAVTPSMVKADIIALYRKWERRVVVEGWATFAKLLVVERNSDDSNRLDVLFPPDLANSLHIFAALAEFRLQYTAAEAA